MKLVVRRSLGAVGELTTVKLFDAAPSTLIRGLLCVALAAGLMVVPDTSSAQNTADADSNAAGTAVAAFDTTDTCSGVTELAFAAVPDLLHTDRLDSLFSLLGRWNAACGPSEAIMRTAILASIWEGTFDESMYDAGIMDHLLWGREKTERVHVQAHLNPISPFYAVASPVDGTLGIARYDSFTTTLADDMLPHAPPASPEEFFCLFYSGHKPEALARLRDQYYAGTELQNHYNIEVDDLTRQAGGRWGIYVGAWMPRGNLAQLGAHPTIGGIFGWHLRSIFGRLVGEVRFLDAKHPYEVDTGAEEDGGFGVIETQDYTSAYIGLEVGTPIARWRRVALDGMVGMGIEGIHYLSGSNDWLNSLNVSAGVGGRYFLADGRGGYLGLDLRFEHTSYDAGPQGSDLRGHAWSLRLVFGTAINHDATRRLQSLEQDPSLR